MKKVKSVSKGREESRQVGWKRGGGRHKGKLKKTVKKGRLKKGKLKKRQWIRKEKKHRKNCETALSKVWIVENVFWRKEGRTVEVEEGRSRLKKEGWGWGCWGWWSWWGGKFSLSNVLTKLGDHDDSKSHWPHLLPPTMWSGLSIHYHHFCLQMFCL